MTYIPLWLKLSLLSGNRKPCMNSAQLFLCCLSRSKRQKERSVFLMSLKKKKIPKLHKQKSIKENLLYCL